MNLSNALITRTLSWFLLLGLLSCVSVSSINAQRKRPPHPPDDHLPPNIKYTIDTLLQNNLLNTQLRNHEQPGFSALITQEFKDVYSLVGGASNIELNTLISKESKFRIGSITKQFTAVAILKLHQEGHLNISDPIQRFFPDFHKYQDTITNKKHPITIEHLLTHTSGLADDWYLFKTLSPRVVYPNSARSFFLDDYLKDYPVQSKPGTVFSYSNFGYVLLGLIIEIASRKSYEDYVQTELFDVAGMENTTIDHPSKIIDNRVQGYRMGDSGLNNAGDEDLLKAFSAGNIISTVGDLNKWYHALFNGQIISRDLLKKAHTVYLKREDQPKEYLPIYTPYGYGWAIYSQGQIHSHGGLISGFRSSVIFIASLNIFVVLLSNFYYPEKDITIDNLSSKMLLEAINYSSVRISIKRTITNNLKTKPIRINYLKVVGFNDK